MLFFLVCDQIFNFWRKKNIPGRALLRGKRGGVHMGFGQGQLLGARLSEEHFVEEQTAPLASATDLFAN